MSENGNKKVVYPEVFQLAKPDEKKPELEPFKIQSSTVTTPDQVDDAFVVRAVDETPTIKEIETPKKGGGGDGDGGGGFQDWWDSRSKMFKRATSFTLLLLVFFCGTELQDWRAIRSQGVNNHLDNEATQAKLTQAKILKEVAKIQATTQQLAVVSEPESFKPTMFVCRNDAELKANFALYVDKAPAEVSPGKYLHLTGGCIWARFGYRVTFLQGENYVISLEGTGHSDICGKVPPYNDTDADCLQKINSSSNFGKRFRVSVHEAGYLKMIGENHG
jgi:hypothetical protein